MNTKHTLGKWTLNNTNRNDMLVRNGENGFVIAEVSNQGISHFIGNSEEAEANAQLIASSPELLQMVYDLKNCISRLCHDRVTQEDRDNESQWIGEAHELLHKINKNYYHNANQ